MQDIPVLRWIFGFHDLVEAILLCHLRLGVMKLPLLFGVITSFALSLRAWISDPAKFSSSSMSATKISPSQIPSAYTAYPRNIPGNTFLPNWWSLCWSSAEMDGILPRSQTESRGLQMILQIAFHEVFSHLPAGSGHFADNSSIPLDQPIIFHPRRIVTVQQMVLLLFCVPLPQQYHLSRIDGSLMFAKFQRIVCINVFRLSDGSRNFPKLLFVS